MTTDEDRVMLLKAPEKANKWTFRQDYWQIYLYIFNYPQSVLIISFLTLDTEVFDTYSVRFQT